LCSTRSVGRFDRGGRELIADASNQEIQRLNARAQPLRAQREELGELEVPVSGVHYGVRQGDRVVMIEQHREHGQERIENGTLHARRAAHPSRRSQAAKDGKVRPLRQAPVVVGATSGERARWLKPYDGDHEWRTEMWGQVVALHGRYPHHLENLKDKWWTNDAHTETLSALATWRAEIDDAGG